MGNPQVVAIGDSFNESMIGLAGASRQDIVNQRESKATDELAASRNHPIFVCTLDHAAHPRHSGTGRAALQRSRRRATFFRVPDSNRPAALAKTRVAALLVLLFCDVAVAGQLPAAPKNLVAAAKAQFAEAEKSIAQGDLLNALGKVQEGLRLAPQSIEGYNLLGMIYNQQKDYARALAAFEQALKLNPRSTVTHNNLGGSYSSQNKLDLAEREFRTTLQLDPRNRDGNYNLGLLLLAKGNAKEASAYLERVRPPDPASLLSLVQAYFQLHDTAKALERSRALSTLAKNDVRVRFSLGVLLASQKQYEPAAREFELADALMPRTFEILHNLGQTYLRLNKPEKAEEVLQRALGLKPDSPETLYLLGKLYSDEKKYVQAMEMLVPARKLAPRNTDIIFLLSRVSMLQAYYEDAIQLLEQGVKIAPERPDLHAALGESYFTAGKVDRAIQEFETLVRLNPSAGSFNFLGLCYRHLGRYAEARKYFQQGLERDPRSAPCLYNLGFIASKQGNTEEAERNLRNALRIDPNYDDALFELASLKVTQKKYEEALPMLQRCLKLTGKPAPVYYKLSVVERALHQKEAAERDLKVFETLSKEPAQGPYPYQHFFEYFDQRTRLSPEQKTELQLQDLLRMAQRNPDHPSTLYLLAENYLKLGQPEEAKKWIEKLDKLSGGDIRTMLGVGVLLARYKIYPEAIQHFQLALAADPTSDDAKFDLANSYFRLHDYPHALEAMEELSPRARPDDTMLALLADIDAHLGRTKEAIEIFEAAVQKNPENEQYNLSLALTHLRGADIQSAEKALRRGLNRTPNSGKLFWGLGVVSALDGKESAAEELLSRGIDLMPEWQGGYSTLGFLYFLTGQVLKARETFERYMRTFPQGGIDVARVRKLLATADPQPGAFRPLPPEARQQFLEIALAWADQAP